MIIGGDESRLTNNVCGVVNSWFMMEPEKFVINIDEYRDCLSSHELEEFSVLPDNFLLELPLFWENGKAVGIAENLFSAVFFLPEGISGNVRDFIFLGRFSSVKLFNMETKELIEDLAISIMNKLSCVSKVPSTDEGMILYRKNLESAQAVISNLQFAACVKWD